LSINSSSDVDADVEEVSEHSDRAGEGGAVAKLTIAFCRYGGCIVTDVEGGLEELSKTSGDSCLLVGAAGSMSASVVGGVLAITSSSTARSISCLILCPWCSEEIDWWEAAVVVVVVEADNGELLDA
jgi:hypothetical protein